MTDPALPMFCANPPFWKDTQKAIESGLSANADFDSCFAARVERSWPESTHDEPQTPKNLTVLDSRYVPYKMDAKDGFAPQGTHANDALTRMPSL